MSSTNKSKHNELPPDTNADIDPSHGPYAVDPVTGRVETLGKGRTAVIGEQGVQRLVVFPATVHSVDVHVAGDELTYGA